MTVRFHVHALDDLRELKLSDPQAAASVAAALQQVQADPDIVDLLTTFGDNSLGVQRINVKRWESARNRRGDLWRFRVLDSPGARTCRVIYGYHWPSREITVLAIIDRRSRQFDYDNSENPLRQRILADWLAL